MDERLIPMDASALFEQTGLTPEGVAKRDGFLDWDTQPAMFKHYPDSLLRYRFDALGQGEFLAKLRFVTSKIERFQSPYYRLNTPSAGNLHPLELYVQIRGIKGVLSGIYHIDAKNAELVQIAEVGHEGLEPCFGLNKRFSGAIIVLSCVPFRSFWKYGLRGWRYCYLDAGHQLGAIDAAVHNCRILSVDDRNGMNAVMGFDEQESVIAALAIGETVEKPVKALTTALMRVQPTDYYLPCRDIAEPIAETAAFAGEFGTYAAIDPAALDLAVVQRRSARSFVLQALSYAHAERFMQLHVPTQTPLKVYFALLRVEGMTPGIYDQNGLLQSGVFISEVTELLVKQPVVFASAMAFFVTAETGTPQALTDAGLYTHRLYFEAQMNELGFSGIGAYYDDALRALLQTTNRILYAAVLGIKENDEKQ